jgi:hypothetical protein
MQLDDEKDYIFKPSENIQILIHPVTQTPLIDPQDYFITSGDAVTKTKQLLFEIDELQPTTDDFRNEVARAQSQTANLLARLIQIRGTHIHLECWKEGNQVVCKGKDPKNTSDVSDERTFTQRKIEARKSSIFRNKQDGCSSIYKGVSWRKVEQKWQARIKHHNHEIHIGFFAEEEQAGHAYDTYVSNLFANGILPQLPPLNFPGEPLWPVTLPVRKPKQTKEEAAARKADRQRARQARAKAIETS